MILVTGGTGLVGSHLLYKLAQQNETVRAIVRNRNKIEQVKRVFAYYSDNAENLISKIEWLEGDLLDLFSLNSAFKDVKKVYHCAAMVSFDSKDKIKMIQTNVQGTENVVNLCLNHQVKKLCHVSSIASLGGAMNGEIIDENSKWTSSKNHSVYSESKFKSEMEVWRGIQEGLNAVIVNPSVILGPGFWNSGSGSLFSKAAKGMKYFTSGGTGFVDVKDVTYAMVQLMESDISSERFILNSENLPYKELFDVIAETMQVKKPMRKVSEEFLKIAAFFDFAASKVGLKKRELTKQVAKSATHFSQYSNQKITEAIEIDFIPINKSVLEMAEKFKKEITKKQYTD